MKRVGEILKAERKKQRKTLQEIHQKTKIPLETLRALEKDDFNSLPPSTFIKGFIRIYAQTLKLDPERLLAIFRREWQESEKEEVTPRRLESSPTFVWTPKATLILIASVIAGLFLFYLGFQLSGFLSPPDLAVEKPLEDQNIEQESVEVKGKAGKEASVYINNQLIETDEKGNFSYNLKLFPGENKIEIAAIDRKGKKTVIVRKVKVVDKEL